MVDKNIDVNKKVSVMVDTQQSLQLAGGKCAACATFASLQEYSNQMQDLIQDLQLRLADYRSEEKALREELHKMQQALDRRKRK